MPYDLILFAVVVVGFFVVGLPRITRNVTIPRSVELKEVAESKLTDRQRLYFDDMDAKMRALGYLPALTWRATNMQGENLMRTYLSDADDAFINLTLIRSRVEGADDQSASYLEIISRFADGSMITTRNAELEEVLEQLPDHRVIDHRGIRDPAELKARHERSLVDGPSAVSLRVRRDEIFDRFREFHERYCRHQEAVGLVRLDPAAGVYRVTSRAGLRGIRNFLNPFADNFTWPRLALALVFGLGVPVLAVLAAYHPAPRVDDWFAETPAATPAVVRLAVLAAAFTVTGVAVGAIFEVKAFIWSFLLAYLPLRLLGPAGLLPLWISLWTGFVADRTSAWRMRRRHVM